MFNGNHISDTKKKRYTDIHIKQMFEQNKFIFNRNDFAVLPHPYPSDFLFISRTGLSFWYFLIFTHRPDVKPFTFETANTILC